MITRLPCRHMLVTNKAATTNVFNFVPIWGPMFTDTLRGIGWGPGTHFVYRSIWGYRLGPWGPFGGRRPTFFGVIGGTPPHTKCRGVGAGSPAIFFNACVWLARGHPEWRTMEMHVFRCAYCAVEHSAHTFVATLLVRKLHAFGSSYPQ